MNAAPQTITGKRAILEKMVELHGREALTEEQADGLFFPLENLDDSSTMTLEPMNADAYVVTITTGKVTTTAKP